MARLLVRQAIVRDLPALGRSRRVTVDVAPGSSGLGDCSAVRSALAALAPGDGQRVRLYVALVDNVLCAYLVARPDPGRFAWRVLTLAVGAPQLAAHDDEAQELWTSLLEFTIARAGEDGAKRVFAGCSEGTPEHQSLLRVGFEGYTTHMTLATRHNAGAIETQRGVREQEPSDVWSIHHLYHRVTPRPVQFAEALASSYWECPGTRSRRRIPVGRAAESAVVYDSQHGIEAYCRIWREDRTCRLELIVDPVSGVDAGLFVLDALNTAHVSSGTIVRVDIPSYQSECVGALERVGFSLRDERIAMVRHTTAPAVQMRLSPLPAVEAAERAVRGAPTFSIRAQSGARNKVSLFRNATSVRGLRTVGTSGSVRRPSAQRSEQQAS